MLLCEWSVEALNTANPGHKSAKLARPRVPRQHGRDGGRDGAAWCVNWCTEREAREASSASDASRDVQRLSPSDALVHATHLPFWLLHASHENLAVTHCHHCYTTCSKEEASFRPHRPSSVVICAASKAPYSIHLQRTSALSCCGAPICHASTHRPSTAGWPGSCGLRVCRLFKPKSAQAPQGTRVRTEH
jgi:hypothetical protein